MRGRKSVHFIDLLFVIMSQKLYNKAMELFVESDLIHKEKEKENGIF